MNEKIKELKELVLQTLNEKGELSTPELVDEIYASVQHKYSNKHSLRVTLTQVRREMNKEGLIDVKNKDSGQVFK